MDPRDDGLADPNDDLVEAAQNGDIGALRAALASGADAVDVACWAALDADQSAAVIYLLDRGADARGFDDHLFREAAARGNLDIVEWCLEHGADLRAHHEDALIRAAGGGHAQVVLALLSRGADLYVQDEAPLCAAIVNGHADMAKLLIDRGAQLYSEETSAAFVEACQRGHLEIARFLLSQKFSTESFNEEYGLTPLIAAAQYGHLEIARLLLDRGADVHTGGDLPLLRAVENDDVKMVKLLLNHDSKREHWSRSALKEASNLLQVKDFFALRSPETA
jgi:ankyrin repeat protein